MAHGDDDAGTPIRESRPMNSPATSIAYISTDIPEALTLREYGRQVAAERSTGETRLGRALRGIRLPKGTLRLPTPRFA
jgi:hypothetical protein